jgi:predicted metalloprotease with PDZ domain
MIAYRIDVAEPAAHRLLVTLTLASPAPECVLSLPVWIPGSYMVREFGRHLSQMRACQGQAERALEQLDKTTWRVRCEGTAALTLRYEVYAFDPSVRCAFLDDARGFLNPTSVCLRVHGRESEPHHLRIASLPRGWDVATAMTPAPAAARTPAHSYVCADYDELADHPLELGRFWRGEFKAGGVVHEFIVAGAWPTLDGERLLADTQRICAAQIAFWHGKGKPPFARYVFLLNVVEEGYGGLEHRASTALIANRRDLPRHGQPEQSEGYQTLLGLISHEYFHTWNVKRLKPAEFLHYDYSSENYTELLWFFEGFTSYYDDLFLRRTGLIDVPRYLKLLARTFNSVAATPGQAVQSVAQASMDAWVKYYRPDENSPNATVSYYTKGSLIALLLDVRLRAAGAGTLDDLMRSLWRQHASTGLREADVLAAVAAQASPALAQELATWVHGREALPLEPALQALGVQVQAEAPSKAAWPARLGLKLAESPLTGVQVKSVLRASVAEAAGVSAGDELLAVDGWRVRRLDDARQWVGSEPSFELLLVRGQRVRTLKIDWTQGQAAPLSVTLERLPGDADQWPARQSWLGQ